MWWYMWNTFYVFHIAVLSLWTEQLNNLLSHYLGEKESLDLGGKQIFYLFPTKFILEWLVQAP